MDKNVAAHLLASLLERINRNQIGSVSQPERDALLFALNSLDECLGEIAFAGMKPDAATGLNIDTSESLDAGSSNGDEVLNRVGEASLVVEQKEPIVDLMLDSIQLSEATNPEILLCLDFGTAMSKAFAAALPNGYMDLALGAEVGRAGYTIPSTVFISDDGKAYFGFEALERSNELGDSGRERLDSIKTWVSQRQDGDLDGEACLLKFSHNPTKTKLTQGDLIRLYLAYLTDTACNALIAHEIEGQKLQRYVKRRYARPCWPNEQQTRWADLLMRNLLAEAQVLADTFSRQWAGGIDVFKLKAAIEQVKKLKNKPAYLVDLGVPEPVAVAAGAIGHTDNLRDAFMVVDVGAGTTDFGLFVHIQGKDHGEAKLFQIPGSIHGLMQAGDKLDTLLRSFITKKEAVDSKDASGQLIEADLRRKIRALKETLFNTGQVKYVLADGTVGEVSKIDFLADPLVKSFAKGIESGFKKALESVDDTWLKWLAMDGVKLHVVLTGGSSKLPMMGTLANGVIEVNGYKLMRLAVDPRPDWMGKAPVDLISVYPQLAVAIGGASEFLPDSYIGPAVFGGGVRKAYVAGSLQITGS